MSATHPPRPRLWHSRTYIHIGSARVRKGLVKAALAYGGATLMAFDAVASIAGPELFPHVFHACEAAISCGGKVGAASAGMAAFFDGLIRAALAEAAALGEGIPQEVT